ncbi:MAG: flagellar type III secretion system pore protein FliP [Acidimicrobiales bacterium]
MALPSRRARWAAIAAAPATLAVAVVAALTVLLLLGASPALAQTPDTELPSGPVAGQPGGGVPTVTVPSVSSPAASTGDSNLSIDVSLPGVADRPSQSVLVIVLLTLLSLAPSLVIMLTGFTRIVIVLSLARNALGLPTVPPNQVITGLALFLTLFVMSPTLTKAWNDGLKPYLDGNITTEQAYEAVAGPMKEFMLDQTRSGELQTMIDASREERPATREDVSLTTLIPAFILSELKTAFIIGFVVFIPFLVIDLVVSSALMSMGMMMLPPSLVSLPFKLLLFVMVDGWGLLISSLLTSFR